MLERLSFPLIATTPMFSHAISTAAQGMQTNVQRMAAVPYQFADPDFGPVDAIVELKQSELGVKANAAVIRTADEMFGTLIDVIA